MPSEYANDLMARVGLDTTEWKKGITDLNAGIKHIETGFQASAALMDDWSNSSEGLGKRVESLNDKLALQKQKLEILKKAYEEEVAANGASSKAAEELAKKMYACKADIEKTKTSLDKYAEAEENVSNKTKQLIAKLEESGNKFISAGDKISGIGSKLTTGITTPVLAAGGAIYKFGSDLTEAKNKAESTFGYMSSDIISWAENSLEAMGMAKATALDAVALYGDMATSMELSKPAAAEMSKKLVKLSADLSSFKNISIETAQGALKGIFTGETESLKNLGIVMTDTQLKAYALAEGFSRSYEDMSQAEKVQLRYQYVLDKSANAIGDYSRTSDEAAGQMRKLPEALKELAASFNDNIAPTITPIIKALNDAISSFGKLDDGTKKTIVTIAALAAATGPVLLIGGKVVTLVGKVQKGYAALQKTLLAKTKATKAATTAETAHAGALKTVGAAAKTATPYLLAIAAAIAVVTAMENAHDEAIAKKYNNLTEKSNEHYDGLIQKVQEAAAAEEKAASERIAALNQEYDEKEKRAKEDYKAQKIQIENEKKLYEKAHEARMEQLEAERNAKISNIKLEASSQIAVLQEQIDSLNAITEAEEKAEQERQNQEKLAELKRAIDAATTYSDKVEAEKAYNDFLRQLELEKSRETRELQIKDLEKQIENIETESDKKQEAVDAEYEAAKKLEDDKRTYAQEMFEKRLKDLESFVERANAILEEERNKEIEKIESQSKAKIAQLEAEILRLTEEKAGKEKMYSDLSEWEQENTTFWGGTNYIGKAQNQAEMNAERAAAIASGEKVDTGPFANITGHDWRVGANAEGTDNWRGGLTWVHEEGGEIINLPRGTQIIPHDVSMEYARAAGKASVTNNNNNTETNNYNYGAKQHVTVLSIGDRTVAKVIEPTMSVRSANNIHGRRRSGG